jgi:hypothetical protein
MGQSWLSLNVMGAQAILSSFGLMDTLQLMALGFINVLDVIVLGQRT